MRLAEALEAADFNVLIDKDPGAAIYSENRHLFMERACWESDFVLVLCSREYARRADQDEAGVGYESQQLRLRLEEQKEDTGSTTIRVVKCQRSRDSVPRYLRMLTSLDGVSAFSGDDDGFDSLVRTLLPTVQPRSPNDYDVAGGSDRFSNHFTRSDDLIYSHHPKARCLIRRDSQSPRNAQFELWQIDFPSPYAILLVFDRILVNSLVGRYRSELEKRGIELPVVKIVVRADYAFSPKLKSALRSEFPDNQITFLTIDEFIDKNFVTRDNEFSNAKFATPYYIDQDLYEMEGGALRRVADQSNACEYLTKNVTEQSSVTANLLIGDGGCGKSEICISIHNRLLNRSSGKSQSMLLSTADFVTPEDQQVFRNALAGNRIQSIYDIYKVFAIAKSEHVYNRTDFDICLLSGKITLIVDGLDEIYFANPGQFQRRSFLRSVNELNNQLGRINVILASRRNLFEDVNGDAQNVKVFYILGFKDADIDRYFDQRFKDQDSIAKYARVLVQGFKKDSGRPQVSPYVVDLISSECADDSRQRIAIDSADGSSLCDEVDHPILGNSYDIIVFGFLARECRRQQLESRNLDQDQLFAFFRDLAVEDHSSQDDVKAYASLVFESEVLEAVLSNPLLELDKDRLIYRFRYDFLEDYFRSVFAITKFKEQDFGALAVSVYSRFGHGYLRFRDGEADSAQVGFAYIAKALGRNKEEHIGYCERAIPALARQLEEPGLRPLEIQNTQLSISFYIHLMSEFMGNGVSNEEFSNRVFELLENRGFVKHLYVFGNLRKLIFSGREFQSCKFVDYLQFTECEFEGAKFVYCEVQVPISSYASSTLTGELFDSSCKLGDLGSEFGRTDTLQRLLSRFYSGGQFVQVSADELSGAGNGGKFEVFIRNSVELRLIRYLDSGSYTIPISAQYEIANYLKSGYLGRRLRRLKALLSTA